MLYSILLSTYYKEQASFLESSLNSIFNQTLPPSEIILVADGPLTSELDLLLEQYLNKYPFFKVVRLSNNLGLGKALNEGLLHCSNNLIARMDTDDIAKPNRFEMQMNIFKTYPDIDVVGAWIDEFEGDISHIISIRKVPEFQKEIFQYGKSRNPINHPVVMFKKDAVLSVGGYLHFPLFEDYYLWIRMIIAGAKFYNIQESLLFFRFSSEVFKRRGGWKYALNEFRFQNAMRKIGYISFFSFLLNVPFRFVIRIMPNTFRMFLYKKILR